VYYTNTLLWRIRVAGKNKKCLGLHVTCPIFLSNFLQNLEFLNKFSQMSPISDFTEKLPVTAALLHAGQTDGRTDITKLVSVFRAYKNMLKINSLEGRGIGKLISGWDSCRTLVNMPVNFLFKKEFITRNYLKLR